MKAETSIDLRYNIAAMCIAILKEDIATPEQAFAVVSESRCKLTDEDTLDMIAMRDRGVEYQEIARIYGYTVSGIKNRIYKYKKETSLDGHPKRSIK